MKQPVWIRTYSVFISVNRGVLMVQSYTNKFPLVFVRIADSLCICSISRIAEHNVNDINFHICGFLAIFPLNAGCVIGIRRCAARYLMISSCYSVYLVSVTEIGNHIRNILFVVKVVVQSSRIFRRCINGIKRRFQGQGRFCSGKFTFKKEEVLKPGQICGCRHRASILHNLRQEELGPAPLLMGHDGQTNGLEHSRCNKVTKVRVTAGEGDFLDRLSALHIHAVQLFGGVGVHPQPAGVERAVGELGADLAA